MSVRDIKLMEYDAKRKFVRVRMYCDDVHTPDKCPPKVLALLKSIEATSCKKIDARVINTNGEWDCEYVVDVIDQMRGIAKYSLQRVTGVSGTSW